MRFQEFERRAWEDWDRIPEAYKAGVDGLVVERRAQPHPELPDVYTLGECLTEEYLSDYGGPETTRSVVVLYYGSFRRLSRLDPEFDWDAELWETLTHELRHHLESLATEDALEGVDYAADENYKRREGEPFDPFFYRSGEEVEPGVFRVEQDLFLERVYADGAEPAGEWVHFDWQGDRYRVPRPDRLGDVCFIDLVDGLDGAAGGASLVLVRRRGLGAALKVLLRRHAPEVLEYEAAVERREGE